MTCEEVRPLIGAFYDNEILDVLVSQQVSEHLETCKACAQELAAIENVSRSLRVAPNRFQTPEGLQKKIEAVAGVDSLDALFARNRVGISKSIKIFYFCFGGIATFGVLALIALFRAPHRLEADLVADHIRSLQANHLFDVPSSDKHTVKPWFQGRLDFSPTVPDLTKQGFPLLGGRLDFVNNHPAAAIVYGRAKHIINVFVTRSADQRVESGTASYNGFHVVAWSNGGLDYWAVSDVNPSDLSEFKRDYQAAKTSAPAGRE